MATRAPGSWVWMPDEADLFVPAKVLEAFKPGEEAKVQTEDGETHKIDGKMSKEMEVCDPQCLDASIENLIMVNDLNESSILHLLRARFKQNLVYSNVASILVAINPFKRLPLYTPEMMELYRDGSRGKPPHIFGIGIETYQAMMQERKDQSVVISGESGAGKSVATKLCLQFIADASARASGKSNKKEGEVGIEEQVLQTNPILESQGNAKTLRNNNSSRFGKLITVKFDKNGGVVGANIIDYLLEKSRVTFQAQGERNYHVFYMIIAGCKKDAALKERLHLTEAVDYHYLDQSGVTETPGFNDDFEYEDMVRSYGILNYSEEEHMAAFQIFAAVLHFSNVAFEPEPKAMEEDGSKIGNPETLKLCADLIGLDMDLLVKALTTKNVGNKSSIVVSYTPPQALATRDAMVKAIYGGLFTWSVAKCNTSMDQGAKHEFFSAMLDIFGFESFYHNSFEQLCINLCNEKLQFFFNEHIFKLEEEQYGAEGVVVPRSDFEDNGPTLEMLEKPRTGILSMIDEELSVPRGSDATLLSKVLKAYDKHKQFEKPNSKNCPREFSRLAFGVIHYAGLVMYDTTNFLDKNKDQLHPDVIAMLHSTSSDMLKKCIPPIPEKGGGKKKSKQMTLGGQFKNSLKELIDTLHTTEPHFVRCMKPNKEKVGDVFTSPMMLEQMRYSGLLEVCRIRKLGYPLRKEFTEFFKRYKTVVRSAKNIDELLDGLEKKNVLKEKMWAKGKTKVFMKSPQSVDLEIAREESLVDTAIVTQKYGRRYVVKKKMKMWRAELDKLKEAIATRELEKLDEALHATSELPGSGKHLKLVKDAEELLIRLQEEKRVEDLLAKAIEKHDKSSLTAAIDAAAKMSPPFEPANLADANAMLKKIEREAALLESLKDATARRDKATLDSLLHEADDLELGDDNEIVAQAHALFHRLAEEEEVTLSLEAAVHEADLPHLTAFINKASELGFEPPVLAEAKALQEKLQAQFEAKKAMQAASDARDMDALEAAIGKAQSTGLDPSSCEELAKAISIKDSIAKERAAVERVKQASSQRNLEAIAAAVAAAASIGIGEEVPAYAAVFQEAAAVTDALKKEAEVRKALVDASAAQDPAALSKALGEASSLGISGAEVEEAQRVMKDLGAKGAAAEKLQLAATSDSLEEVQAAVNEGLSSGLSPASPEMVAAKARIDRLKEEAMFIQVLEKTTASGEGGGDALDKISTLIAEGTKMGIANKYAESFAKAKKRQEELQNASTLYAATKACRESRDAQTLRAAVASAESKGVTDLAEAKALLADLDAEEAILSQIELALKTKDLDELRSAYEAASGRSMTHDKVNQCKIALDREELVQKTNAIVKMDEDDFKNKAAEDPLDLEKSLNEALENAISLGLSREDIAKTTAKRDEIAALAELKRQVLAIIETLEVKQQSPSGITAEDLEPISKVVEDAKAAGMADKALEDASKAVDKARKQLQVQKQLSSALKSKDRKVLKAALDAAEDLELSLTFMDQVKKKMKSLDADYRAAQQKAMEDDVPTSEALHKDADGVAKARDERVKRAGNPKYRFQNFAGLRSVDDFARGILMRKRQVKDGMLKWSGSLVPRSLLELDPENNRVALQIHKCLLGYMGDKSMAFPATLAQDVLQKGLDPKTPAIRDEIYMQVMKQLTSNPTAESIARGWQMMCMCVATFPPSIDLENYVVNFLLAQREKRGAVRNYAKYCLRTLEGMLESGASGFAPSVDEIGTYKDRPPILATISLVDGMVLTEDLPITPDLNCAKVCEICAQFLELSDPRHVDTFGIFVYDLPRDEALGADPDADKPFADLERTPRPMRGDDFMGDIIVQKSRQKRSFKFVYKRKIFLPSQNGPSDDEMFSRLVYLQAEDDVINNGTIAVKDEEQALKLAAISLSVAMGDDFTNDPEDLLALEGPSVLDFLPPKFRSLDPDEVAKNLVALRGPLGVADVAGADEDAQTEFVNALQRTFVEEVCDLELYGSHLFYCHRIEYPSQPDVVADMPHDVAIAFSAAGMFVFDTHDDMEQLYSYGYADIYRWGGSSSVFSLYIWNAETESTFELKLSTAQAADMAGIILDYINAIMAAQGAD
ncbi:hypothetical protein CTAYLR_001247 [Chrysophaeum taylorii]|uniref:Uncharacterized protein n=1 Tax=Chrysophaeum taylorii TaxID=2483200 RepID=A0AAD7UDH2_9STRA|nr:hypothetical protein CTAYLR_001247 [Chrysophaeum taylorii]